MTDIMDWCPGNTGWRDWSRSFRKSIQCGRFHCLSWEVAQNFADKVNEESSSRTIKRRSTTSGWWSLSDTDAGAGTGHEEKHHSPFTMFPLTFHYLLTCTASGVQEMILDGWLPGFSSRALLVSSGKRWDLISSLDFLLGLCNLDYQDLCCQKNKQTKQNNNSLLLIDCNPAVS